MCLRVDPRAGSGHLAPILRTMGVDARLTRLPYGDFAWTALGPDGCPIPCAVELKTLSDLLSCITTKRFTGHQLPGLLYHYQLVWLMVQGEWRSDSFGAIVERGYKGHWQSVRAPITYRGLAAFFASLQYDTGLQILVTTDERSTLATLAALYTEGRKSPGHRHSSQAAAAHGHMVRSLPVSLTRSAADRDYRTRLEVAAAIPGVGDRGAILAATAFPSPRAMALATEEQWNRALGIKGKAGRVKTGTAIVRAWAGSSSPPATRSSVVVAPARTASCSSARPPAKTKRGSAGRS